MRKMKIDELGVEEEKIDIDYKYQQLTTKDYVGINLAIYNVDFVLKCVGCRM